MKKITLSFPFSKLWNTEYTWVMGQILEIMKKHNPEQLNLKKPYDRLNVLRSSISQIQIQAKASGITNTITDTDELRDRITAFLFKQIKNYKLLGLSPYVEKAKVLEVWVKKYEDMHRENYAAQTEKTTQFLNEIESLTELKEAMEVLNLIPFVTKLKETNTEFEKLFRNRIEEVSKIPNIDIKAIRSKVDDAANKLLVAIVFCKEEYEDKDYMPLINELTELFSYHKTVIKSRNKEAKKNKEKNIQK